MTEATNTSTTPRTEDGKAGVGRDRHLDWTLPDPTRHISGKHCEIRFFDGAYWLYDVSTNGTFVNKSTRRVQSPYRLSDGDELLSADADDRGVATVCFVEPELVVGMVRMASALSPTCYRSGSVCRPWKLPEVPWRHRAGRCFEAPASRPDRAGCRLDGVMVMLRAWIRASIGHAMSTCARVPARQVVAFGRCAPSVGRNQATKKPCPRISRRRSPAIDPPGGPGLRPVEERRHCSRCGAEPWADLGIRMAR